MNRLNTILFATDLSEASAHALEHAALIAAKNDAALHVVNVRIPFSESVFARAAEMPGHRELDEALENQTKTEIEGLKPSLDIPVIKRVLSDYDAAKAITEYAEQNQIDLIIVGTHQRHGLAQLFLGSVAGRIIRQSSMSVLAVGPDERQTGLASHYERILVPIDFSQASERALRNAKRMAEAHDSELIAVHVIENVPYPAYYTAGAHTIMEAFPDLARRTREAFKQLLVKNEADNARVIVTEGKAHQKIDDVARENDVDVIVMGWNGLGDVEARLLGSVTERTLRRAPCPVLVDKSDEALNV